MRRRLIISKIYYLTKWNRLNCFDDKTVFFGVVKRKLKYGKYKSAFSFCGWHPYYQFKGKPKVGRYIVTDVDFKTYKSPSYILGRKQMIKYLLKQNVK